MSTLKTNQMRHLDNSGTANIVLTNTGEVAVATNATIAGNATVSGNSTLTGTVTMANTLSLTNQDVITMQNFTIGSNGKGNRTVSTTAPSTTSGYSNGDIWYEVA